MLEEIQSTQMNHESEVRAWSTVLRSTKTSTLKFALARAILDEVRQPHQQRSDTITRELLAQRLVQYYWYQIRQFHLKQASASNQEPNVVRKIRELDATCSTKWQPAALHTRSVIDYVAKHGFDEVIHRFHTGVEGSIFSVNRGRGIAIANSQRVFLGHFGSLLMPTILAGWAAQVERYNHAPRVLAKVGFDGRRRAGANKWTSALRLLENACFYCRIPDPRFVQVDHVIPWSFVFDDAEWNLVLACGSCNNQKRDRIPASRFLEALCERNSRLISANTDDFSGRVRFSLSQLPYTGHEGQHKSIMYLCEQALLQGFSNSWTPVQSADCF